MVKNLLTTILTGLPFIVLNGGDFYHMMDWGHHMMDWWGIPYMGLWWIGVWIAQLIIAFLVLRDCERRKMNGLLWFIIIILPWIGILFIIGYLIIRREEDEVKESLDDAHKILDERYAKGEITRREYQQAKMDIEEMRRKYEPKQYS
ncbi:MAG: SHOCT domain-containing protein [Thermoplasmatales archaeon]|nr:MAG: SHOCT domain-containing protein [Thermoplasmatales archaeon]